MKPPSKSFYLALAGGALGAFLVLLVSHASRMAQIDAGDWLQAISTIAGIGLTVRATIWLEDRKRRQQRIDDYGLLSVTLQNLRSHIAKIRNPDDEVADLGQRVRTTAAHYELIRNTRASLVDARAGLRIRDHNLWSALHALDHEFAIAADTLEREERIIRGQGVSEQVLAISRERLMRTAEAIAPPVEVAIAALSGGTDRELPA